MELSNYISKLDIADVNTLGISSYEILNGLNYNFNYIKLLTIMKDYEPANTITRNELAEMVFTELYPANSNHWDTQYKRYKQCSVNLIANLIAC